MRSRADVRKNRAPLNANVERMSVPLLISLGCIAFGAVLIWLSGMLLAEYRRVFFGNPLVVMSLDVIAQILTCGAPGYLALLCYGIGAYFLVMGAGLLLYEAGSFVTYLYKMISLSVMGK